MSAEVTPEVLEALQRLAKSCHARCVHPEYEYDTTETGRKTSEEGHPPEGHGWERNVDKGDDGWERFEYTEEHYWRRLKTDAEKDPMNPFNLPRVTLPSISHREFREFFESIWRNSRPRALVEGITHIWNFKDFRYRTSVLQVVCECQQDKDEAFTMGVQPGKTWVGLDLGDVRIYIQEIDPVGQDAYLISCRNKAGHWSEWSHWNHDYSFNIDMLAVHRELRKLLMRLITHGF